MTWEYQTEYNKLLEKLDTDKRPWRPASLIPVDGTMVYIKCGVDYKGETLYDFGRYSNYVPQSWYIEAKDIKGEWDTEFGNMEECTGWKEL